MITVKQGLEIRKRFGNRFLEKISEGLVKKKILNKRTKLPFTEMYLSYILRGERENKIVENEIWQLFEEEIQKEEELKEKRDKLIERNKKLDK